MHFDLPIGSPTTRLWLAILDQAVHDARLKTPRTAEERWAKKDAIQWFHARGVTTGSFQWMCEVLLKKNPDRVLAALKLTKEEVYPCVTASPTSKPITLARAMRSAKSEALDTARTRRIARESLRLHSDGQEKTQNAPVNSHGARLDYRPLRALCRACASAAAAHPRVSDEPFTWTITIRTGTSADGSATTVIWGSDFSVTVQPRCDACSRTFNVQETIYCEHHYKAESTRAQRALRAARDAARPRGPDGKLIRGRPAAANPSRRAIISRRYREKQLALGLAKK